jgi:hypothetical protein
MAYYWTGHPLSTSEPSIWLCTEYSTRMTAGNLASAMGAGARALADAVPSTKYHVKLRHESGRTSLRRDVGTLQACPGRAGFASSTYTTSMPIATRSGDDITQYIFRFWLSLCVY